MPVRAFSIFVVSCLSTDMPDLLTLAEAFHWVQIGFCFAIGFGIAYGIVWLASVLFLFLGDR